MLLIQLLCDRCPLAKLKHIYTEESSLSAEQQLEDIAKICSEHLASLVELKWTLSPRFTSIVFYSLMTVNLFDLVNIANRCYYGKLFLLLSIHYSFFYTFYFGQFFKNFFTLKKSKFVNFSILVFRVKNVGYNFKIVINLVY